MRGHDKCLLRSPMYEPWKGHPNEESRTPHPLRAAISGSESGSIFSKIKAGLKDSCFSQPWLLVPEHVLNVLPSQGHIDGNFSSSKSCPSLVFLILHNSLSFLLPFALSGVTVSLYITTERTHSLKWFGLKKNKKLLNSKQVLCLCEIHSMLQLVDDSSSKTKGIANLSAGAGANALGQKPLPVFAAR